MLSIFSWSIHLVGFLRAIWTAQFKQRFCFRNTLICLIFCNWMQRESFRDVKHFKKLLNFHLLQTTDFMLSRLFCKLLIYSLEVSTCLLITNWPTIFQRNGRSCLNFMLMNFNQIPEILISWIGLLEEKINYRCHTSNHRLRVITLLNALLGLLHLIETHWSKILVRIFLFVCLKFTHPYT
jgi:hypothetical protein